VGTDEPFDPTQLRALNGDKASYRARFNSRLDALVAEGWLLGDDADEMRREPEQVDF
jgi:Alpha/beta hydrolase domain